MADFTPTASPTDMPPDVLPAWVGSVAASTLLGFSIIVYGWLALAQQRVEQERKEADILRMQRMAQRRDEGEAANKRRSTIWRGKAAQSIFVKPLSQVDMWVRENARPLKNFILSALVFFAIPNLYLLSILKSNFLLALLCLTVLSTVLSVGLLFGILYYSSFGSPRDKICFKHFVAENKYEHLGLPLIDIIVLGIGQLTLLGLYIWSLRANGEPPLDKTENYMYYCLGVVMQVAYGHDMKIWKSVGHHARFWIAVFRARRLDERFISSNDIRKQEQMSYSFRDHRLIHVRFLISHVINTFGCFVIMMGIPIQVATQDNPMDFVLNVVAGFYIVEWDDLDEKEMDYTQQLDEENNDDILNLVDIEEGSDNGNTDGSFFSKEKSVISLKHSRSKRDRVENDIRAMQIKLAELDILKEELAELSMQVSSGMGGVDFDSLNGSEGLGEFLDCESGSEGAFTGEEFRQTKKVTFK